MRCGGKFLGREEGRHAAADQRCQQCRFLETRHKERLVGAYRFEGFRWQSLDLIRNPSGEQLTPPTRDLMREKAVRQTSATAYAEMGSGIRALWTDSDERIEAGAIVATNQALRIRDVSGLDDHVPIRPQQQRLLRGFSKQAGCFGRDRNKEFLSCAIART